MENLLYRDAYKRAAVEEQGGKARDSHSSVGIRHKQGALEITLIRKETEAGGSLAADHITADTKVD